MFNIKVDYPSMEEEKRISGDDDQRRGLPSYQSPERQGDCQHAEAGSERAVGEYVIDFATRLVRATPARESIRAGFVRKMVDWGAGPRAGIFLIQGGKAWPPWTARFSVAVDDIKKSPSPFSAIADQHEFPGPGRGQDERGHYPAIAGHRCEPEPPKLRRERNALHKTLSTNIGE